MTILKQETDFEIKDIPIIDNETGSSISEYWESEVIEKPLGLKKKLADGDGVTAEDLDKIMKALLEMAQMMALHTRELLPKGGVDDEANDLFSRSLTEWVSRINRERRELMFSRQLELYEGYTPLERKIALMMTENTGGHILDSGDYYGRHWERNRCKDLKREPMVSMDPPEARHDGSPDICMSINIFHYLSSRLSLSKESEELQEAFNEYANTPEHRADDWESVLESFIEDMGLEVTCRSGTGDESLLSQNAHGIGVQRDGDEFVFLSLHNGQDIRGGYTSYYVFEASWGAEGLFYDTYDLMAACLKCGASWSSDDSGGSWHLESYEDNEDTRPQVDKITLSKWKRPRPECYKPRLLFQTDASGTPRHIGCHGKIEFDVGCGI